MVHSPKEICKRCRSLLDAFERTTATERTGNIGQYMVTVVDAAYVRAIPIERYAGVEAVFADSGVSESQA